MNDYLLHDYLPAFASTVAVELGVAVLLGFWSRRELLAVLGVNFVTHPTLHVILWAIFWTKLAPLTWPVLTALEVMVCVAEWWMLVWWPRLPARRAGLVSLAMNAASALLGLVLVG